MALANAVGAGVADDKAVYAYMPRVIRYYLGQEPILHNVETHICREPEALRYTLDHLAELVVKPVGEAGGYGITVGPNASRQSSKSAAQSCSPIRPITSASPASNCRSRRPWSMAGSSRATSICVLLR